LTFEIGLPYNADVVHRCFRARCCGVLALGLLFVLRVSAQGPPPKPASAKELAAITERGRLLAEYDRAAWQATDAVLSQPPTPGTIQRYLARKKDDLWTVVFGRLNEKGDRFLVAAKASQDARNGTFNVVRYPKPREEGGAWLEMARAVETVAAQFNGGNRAYNIALLPASNGEYYIYLIPAQIKANVFPLGGDTRYRVSRDGRQIRETRLLHRGVMEVRAQEKFAAHVHTHVYSPVQNETPEDTDVFHVLARKPAIPEIIVTKNFAYEIKTDGTIRFAGLVKDMIEASSKSTPPTP
jgi:hypothetical protein